jgi:hypothetical protein
MTQGAAVKGLRLKGQRAGSLPRTPSSGRPVRNGSGKPVATRAARCRPGGFSSLLYLNTMDIRTSITVFTPRARTRQKSAVILSGKSRFLTIRTQNARLTDDAGSGNCTPSICRCTLTKARGPDQRTVAAAPARLVFQHVPRSSLCRVYHADRIPVLRVESDCR